MVSHKSLDYESNGHQVPPLPRVPRSAKGKRSVRKKVGEKQITAFDLLARVAGELLSESENSPPPSTQPQSLDIIKPEHRDHEKPFKPEAFDHGSCNESTCCSGYTLKEQQLTPKLIDGGKSESSERSPSSQLKDPGDHRKLEIGSKTPLQAERRTSGSGRNEILEDPVDVEAKPPALVSSDSSGEVAVSRSRSLVHKDDDENSSGCTHPSANFLKALRAQRMGGGDRMRIRKLFASKFLKLPNTLKDGELMNADEEMKAAFRSRKVCYTRQRTQRCTFKRRKLFARSSISAPNGGIYGEATDNSPKLGGVKIPSVNGAHGASSSTSAQKSSFESGDYDVKLRIKSFRVPELFIEIPENATVGSLKRTVMEAVTAILAGGLRVGVLLQGKKVRDDKQTLLQAGISRSERMENLGFTLEPNSSQTTPPSLVCSENPTLLPSPSTEPIKSVLPAPPAIEQRPVERAPEPPQTLNLAGFESDRDSAHAPTVSSDSKPIIHVPAVKTEALAVVPLRKSKRPELVQRRIRRPFSVAEVEALVQAVERLGTGRWRDVKIRAFDSEKHRTYVDLKDKWKTLVHTARISPQQRRGEPVPQELLDRVLSAHAYWSQQQAKLQVKHSQA